MTRTLAAALLLAVSSPALAGHSRHPYLDAGQSADGRYVVTPESVEEPAAGKKPAASHWKFTWKDTKTGAAHAGKLEGLRSGGSSVFEPVHGHVFVAPAGRRSPCGTRTSSPRPRRRTRSGRTSLPPKRRRGPGSRTD